MARILAVSLLAASLSVLLVPSAHAFGVKPVFSKVDISDLLDFSDSLPFLASILNSQRNDSTAGNQAVLTSASAGEQISTPVTSAAVSSITEGFNNITDLSAKGWAFKNNSSPAPSTTTSTANWEQGVAGNPINAQAGAANSYISASSATSTSGSGQLSNWLITPEINFSNTNAFSFYTRTFLGNPVFEVLEVRLSTSGASVDVGSSSTSLGVFTNLLQTIGNPTGNFSTYPGSLSSNNAYQQFNLNITPQGGSGRIAFRYVTNYAPEAIDSLASFIAIDSVVYSAPEPAMASGLSGFAVLGIVRLLKGKRKQA